MQHVGAARAAHAAQQQQVHVATTANQGAQLQDYGAFRGVKKHLRYSAETGPQLNLNGAGQWGSEPDQPFLQQQMN